MMRVVSMMAPTIEAIPSDEPVGYWRWTVSDRLRATRGRADQMGRVWLPPFVPRYQRSETVTGGWVTGVVGYLRATPVRAMRRAFGDTARDGDQCGSTRALDLSSAWKQEEPAVRWADMGDPDAWPIAWRVDAARLADRFAQLARATWCMECDDAVWASASLRCLTCEPMGASRAWMPPAAMERAA